MCSFYLHTACCLSQLLLSELSIWMSTLLLQRVMQQQVSLGLVCLLSSVCLSVSLSLAQPLPLSFPQFCLTAIIMCLPNGIHFLLPFASISIFLGLTFYHTFPLTLTVMGETEKAPYCCLASLFLLFTARALTVFLLTRLGGKWTLWHFTRWNVAAHGITCKHCSLLPWQLRTKIQPSCTCLCQRLHTNGTVQLQDVRHDQSWEAVFFSIFLFPAFNHIIECTLLLSCRQRSDYIF